MRELWIRNIFMVKLITDELVYIFQWRIHITVVDICTKNLNII